MGSTKILFLIAILIHIAVAQDRQCFFEGCLFAGPTLNLDSPDLAQTVQDCQWLCQQTPDCLYWNWVSPEYDGWGTMPFVRWSFDSQ
ncbi:hypothetical protein TCAL_06583 [Tigriopus californicus]|uniref:Apple domain-containing protein n=1 Tax=Tigriopus californicus TaxID=6832 RepID=A0A553PPP5_TIGCA|nr:hypothetical protein TCAL_06583 [Tigriopus californicus]|eukprot:TCALIF_06583-PA protein Name:"Protein of unknown function" AED:0.37 eAED:0.37 QI:130/1/0.5/1/0/0.5/2/0/86